MNEYKYNHSLSYENRTMKCMILILVLFVSYVLIILHQCEIDATWYTILNTVILSLLSTLIVFVLWDLNKNKHDEEQHDRYIQETLLKLMRYQNDDSIIKLYNKSSTDDVLRNCLSYYNPVIAPSYLNYLKANSFTYRTGLKYDVVISSSKSSTEDPKIYNQLQTLEYCRHFRVTEVSDIYNFQCFFAMSPTLLDEQMSRTDLFFRETISDEALIENIRDKINNKEKIIELLSLKLYVKDLTKPLSPSEVFFEPYEESGKVTGLLFKVELNNNLFDFEPDYEGAQTGYVSYSAKLKVELTSSNSFYCIFPEPCLMPNFSIYFREFEKKPELVSCLSIATSECSIEDDQKRNNGYHFEEDAYETTQDLKIELKVNDGHFVFPRSGIYFTW